MTGFALLVKQTDVTFNPAIIQYLWIVKKNHLFLRRKAITSSSRFGKSNFQKLIK